MLTVLALLAPASHAYADDKSIVSPWVALQQQSRAALAALSREPGHGPGAAQTPRTIVVGFTGGREGADSRVSGVVRLRRHIESSVSGDERVVALTYNNRDWSKAAADVLERLDADETSASTASESGRPLIIVFGHSWGGGAITRFARQLQSRDVEIALAVYVDAFALRNPRVPGNVRFAVNLYQRSGIFRGLPLRGKSQLVLENPASTTLLANLRIRPQTDRYFGWHWNLVQPLLYRHHHRMGHDVRLRDYLLTLVEASTSDNEDRELMAAPCPSQPERCANTPAASAIWAPSGF